MTKKNKIYSLIFLSFFLFILANSTKAQERKREIRKEKDEEREKGDEDAKEEREGKKRIKGYTFPTKFYPTPVTKPSNTRITSPNSTQSIGAVDNTDVRISPSSNPQAEVHISMDKTNPLNTNIIVSANTTVSGWTQQGCYNYTGGSWGGSDSYPGASIISGGLPTVDGDPSTAYDASGNAFISTMDTHGNGLHIIKSTDKGATWGTPVQICTKSFTSNCGVNKVNNDIDKDMITADDVPNSPYANYIYATWSEFTDNVSTCGQYNTAFIGFCRSTDGGSTFSTPIALRNDLGMGQGANVQTGPNGEVYVCWADYGTTTTFPASSIGFAYSSDGGATFTTTNNAFTYYGIRTIFGADPSFNNIRMTDFPSMAVDKSCGPHSGRIYITYPENICGSGCMQSVINMQYSDDHGATWTPSSAQASISAADQSFFPWISVDDMTGIVSIAYYSFDNPLAFAETNTYVAYSSDFGATFTNIKVSDVHHTTAPIPGYTDYEGDYIGITSYNGNAYVTWMDNRVPTWQVYVSRLNYTGIPAYYTTTPNILNINGPISISGAATYQAVKEVNVPVTSTFQTSSGSNVIIKACNDVHLMNGFSASSLLHAYIDCEVPTCTVLGPNRSSADNSSVYPTIEPQLLGNLSGSDLTLSIFPNPTTGMVSLNFGAQKAGNITVTITDVNGRTVLQSTLSTTAGNNSFDLDLSNLQNAVYSIRVADNSGAVLKRDKIILAK